MGLPENADHAALNVASTVHVRGLQARPGEGSKIIGRSFDYTRATSSSKGPFARTAGIISRQSQWAVKTSEAGSLTCLRDPSSVCGCDPRVVGSFGVADLAGDLGTVARVTMRRPWVAMASFVAVLLVLALGHRWSVTASWFTSDKTCGERHAMAWFAQRLDIDCDRLLRARLWKLYDEGQFGRARRGQGAVEYMKHLERPDE